MEKLIEVQKDVHIPRKIIELKSKIKTEEIKWSYDKQIKEWYCNETSPYANNGMEIQKHNENKKTPYSLTMDGCGGRKVGYFRKLSSAKTVANLLRNG